MKKYPYLFFILFQFNSVFVFSAGEQASGRDSTMDLVGSETYVGSAFLDLDAVINDYYYPYESQPGEAVTFHNRLSPSVVLAETAESTLQVSFVVNGSEFFPALDFNYIIYINDRELLESESWRKAIIYGLETLLAEKTEESRIFFFSEEDGQLLEVDNQTVLPELLKELTDKTEEKVTDYFTRARKDLIKLLEALPDNSMESRYFWLFNKSLTRYHSDVRHLYEIIAGMGDSTIQISFCGNSGHFRAATLNEVIRMFGGSTWYFTGEDDFADALIKDYRIYSRPALSDMNLTVYNLLQNRRQPVRHVFLKYLGAGEHRTFLIPIDLPLPVNDYQIGASLPAVRVLLKYYDIRQGRYISRSFDIPLSYSDSYGDQALSEDLYVMRNRDIYETYETINMVGEFLTMGDYRNALIVLRQRIERLERLNKIYMDEMIEEDIALLRQYRELIFDNRDNPFRAFKSFAEITTRSR